MHVLAEAIVVAVRPHGEHGAVVRALTPDNGLLAGYARGGRSRAMRAVLLPGNSVIAEFRTRSDTQLAAITVELAESRAALLGEPLPAAAIDWITALAAVVLPEGHPYPRVFSALDGVLRAIASAPSVRSWVDAFARYEALMIAELGYGSEEPRDLRTMGVCIRETLLIGRRADVMAARERLMDRIDRALGR